MVSAAASKDAAAKHVGATFVQRQHGGHPAAMRATGRGSAWFEATANEVAQRHAKLWT